MTALLGRVREFYANLRTAYTVGVQQVVEEFETPHLHILHFIDIHNSHTIDEKERIDYDTTPALTIVNLIVKKLTDQSYVTIQLRKEWRYYWQLVYAANMPQIAMMEHLEPGWFQQCEQTTAFPNLFKDLLWQRAESVARSQGQGVEFPLLRRYDYVNQQKVALLRHQVLKGLVLPQDSRYAEPVRNYMTALLLHNHLIQPDSELWTPVDQKMIFFQQIAQELRAWSFKTLAKVTETPGKTAVDWVADAIKSLDTAKRLLEIALTDTPSSERMVGLTPVNLFPVFDTMRRYKALIRKLAMLSVSTMETPNQTPSEAAGVKKDLLQILRKHVVELRDARARDSEQQAAKVQYFNGHMDDISELNLTLLARPRWLRRLRTDIHNRVKWALETTARQISDPVDRAAFTENISRKWDAILSQQQIPEEPDDNAFYDERKKQHVKPNEADKEATKRWELRQRRRDLLELLYNTRLHDIRSQFIERCIVPIFNILTAKTADAALPREEHWRLQIERQPVFPEEKQYHSGYHVNDFPPNQAAPDVPDVDKAVYVRYRWQQEVLQILVTEADFDGPLTLRDHSTVNQWMNGMVDSTCRRLAQQTFQKEVVEDLAPKILSIMSTARGKLEQVKKKTAAEVITSYDELAQIEQRWLGDETKGFTTHPVVEAFMAEKPTIVIKDAVEKEFREMRFAIMFELKVSDIESRARQREIVMEHSEFTEEIGYLQDTFLRHEAQIVSLPEDTYSELELWQTLFSLQVLAEESFVNAGILRKLTSRARKRIAEAEEEKEDQTGRRKKRSVSPQSSSR